MFYWIDYDLYGYCNRAKEAEGNGNLGFPYLEKVACEVGSAEVAGVT